MVRFVSVTPVYSACCAPHKKPPSWLSRVRVPTTLKAKSYLDYSSFSRSGLMEQLLFEGFTRAQAAYGVSVAY